MSFKREVLKALEELTKKVDKLEEQEDSELELQKADIEQDKAVDNKEEQDVKLDSDATSKQDKDSIVKDIDDTANNGEADVKDKDKDQDSDIDIDDEDSNITEEQSTDPSGNEAIANEQLQASEDDIPAMERSGVQADDELEQEDELPPVDTQSIIDAQNAKIQALEAELLAYKAKIDGAFGGGMKPPAGAKISRLYDTNSDIPAMRK